MLKTELPASRAAIARLIPHQGAMCLLERVLTHDGDGIVCESDTHRDPHHPLARDGVLGAVAGLEYALQAMALHGALGAGGVPQPAGYLSALRGVRLHVATLDRQAQPLRITATALVAEARGFIYRFAVVSADRVLLDGQATIILPETP